MAIFLIIHRVCLSVESPTVDLGLGFMVLRLFASLGQCRNMNFFFNNEYIFSAKNTKKQEFHHVFFKNTSRNLVTFL